MAGFGKRTLSRRDVIAGILLVAAIIIVCFLLKNEDKYADCASTVEEAGDMMREKYADRETSLTVLFHNEETTKDTDVDTLYGKILAAGFQNTGKPEDGDYMAISKGLQSGTESYSFDQKDGTLILVYAIAGDFYTTKQQEADFKELADDILSSLKLEDQPDYEKLRAIYQYICDNVETVNVQPDKKNQTEYSAYSALSEGRAVSSGIAQLFYYLAVSEGLECRIQVNDSSAWNLVKLSGNYYYIDAASDTGKSESEWTGFLKGTDHFQEPKTSGIKLPFENTPLVGIDKDYKMSPTDY